MRLCFTWVGDEKLVLFSQEHEERLKPYSTSYPNEALCEELTFLREAVLIKDMMHCLPQRKN